VQHISNKLVATKIKLNKIYGKKSHISIKHKVYISKQTNPIYKMAQNFQNIQVWQDAIALHEDIISVLPKFPKEEIYAMSSQLRRASLSISNNIAEGCGRESQKELRNFLSISMGSLKEVESMMIVAQRLNYLDKEEAIKLIQKITIIGKKLNLLMQRVSEQIHKKQVKKNK